MKQLLLIINPRSGKEQIRRNLIDLVDIFVKAGYEVTIHTTQKPKDAMEVLCQRGENRDLIVVSGGDGTLNEAISGLMMMEEKNRPLLGYIPAGSTNDYASSIGISRNMEQAAHTAVEGESFAADVGRFAGERYFVYVAAFGAFTEVSYRTSQETKNLLGHQAYMLEAVRRVTNLKSYRMRFEWEGQILEEEFILGMVTNALSIGGFKGLVDGAVALDDGEFEVLLIRTPKTPKDIASIASYLLLKEEKNDCVYQFRTKELKVTAEEETDWTLDGEYGGKHKEIVIENLHRAVLIRRERSAFVTKAGKSE